MKSRSRDAWPASFRRNPHGLQSLLYVAAWHMADTDRSPINYFSRGGLWLSTQKLDTS